MTRRLIRYGEYEQLINMQQTLEQLVDFLGSLSVTLRTVHANATGERVDDTKDSIASAPYMEDQCDLPNAVCWIYLEVAFPTQGELQAVAEEWRVLAM